MIGLGASNACSTKSNVVINTISKTRDNITRGPGPKYKCRLNLFRCVELGQIWLDSNLIWIYCWINNTSKYYHRHLRRWYYQGIVHMVIWLLQEFWYVKTCALFQKRNKIRRNPTKHWPKLNKCSSNSLFPFRDAPWDLQGEKEVFWREGEKNIPWNGEENKIHPNLY